MSKTPWSKALKEAAQRGEVIREAANDQLVTYQPRFKFDPDPWVSEIGLRYNGSECFAYPPERTDRDASSPAGPPGQQPPGHA